MFPRKPYLFDNVLGELVCRNCFPPKLSVYSFFCTQYVRSPFHFYLSRRRSHFPWSWQAIGERTEDAIACRRCLASEGSSAREAVIPFRPSAQIYRAACWASP
ncbi:hypothetical protein Mapa_001187 [Marchantia paleacea]|nr:hypothetical protein Mapa_001187 [Marchantia paleacea]